jgi:hypothetical protein
MHKTLIGTSLALALFALAPAAQASQTCKLSFNMAGWSIFYKTASGTGIVTCSNGASLPVKISAKGGGLTVGKSKIQNGIGEFAMVDNIRDVLGSYAAVEAHAGAEKAAHAQAMTNGKVSLALAGKGQGWDLGVAFTRFTIEAR